MARRDPLWLKLLKLGFLVGGGLLFFRLVLYLAAFLGNDIRDLWMQIAGASALFLMFFINLVKRIRLPDDKEGEQAIMPVLSAAEAEGNAITATKDGIVMTDNPNVDNKVLHINHGPSYHNTSGGMMNFGPVTVNQNFGPQQANVEPTPDNLQDRDAEVVPGDETIDISGLIDFSVKLKSPGVSRNTVDNILKKANIKPCATEKDGKAIRNLYPRKESQSAVSEYLADKSK